MIIGEWVSLSKDKLEDKEIVVFKAVGVPVGSARNYTTDPWCGWMMNGEFVRWPHDFPPTHFLRLPK